MTHVTYLFGAGASREVLPINKELTERIKNLVITNLLENNPEKQEGYFGFFRDNYIHILEKAEKELSIDTLAQASFGNEEVLNKLKVLLWIYFSGHAGNGLLDKRYKQLLLKLKHNNSNNFRLRDDVSFLSWNYDLQLEEAYAELTQRSLAIVPNHLYTYPSFRFNNPSALEKNSSSDLFQLIHINGTAGFYYDQELREFKSWYGYNMSDPKNRDQIIKFVAQKFHTNGSLTNALKNCIQFPEEEVPLSTEKKLYINKVSKRTTHLVCVGYSFPDFNRKMDKTIIEEMENLRYIFIQNKKPETVKRNLLSRVPSLEQRINNKSITFIMDDDCDEFHLPPPID